MADKDINNLDDLIGSSGGEPIIVQESSSDKKFLYTLLILLVILFIIAMGIIAYLGSKYFGNDNKNIAKEEIREMPIAKKQAIKKDEVAKKAIEVAKENKSDTLSELENLVKEEEKAQQTKKEEPKKLEPKMATPKKVQTTQENAIAKVASTATGGKNLSEEDLAKIAKLVAQELAKKANNKQNSSNNSVSNSDSDKALVASLESANTDTLKNQAVDTSNLIDSKANKNNNKKIDTFNKVVIENKNNGDDEFAKLSSEIDAILQTKEVNKEEKSLKYGKELKQEIARREKELRYIVVKQGDTLSSLAKKAYGRASAYRKIYEANPDLIKNPNRIYIGMKLRVPVDEEYIKKQGK